MSSGGRNCVKSQGEVRVATDRQIAAAERQIGKVNNVCCYCGKVTRSYRESVKKGKDFL